EVSSTQKPPPDEWDSLLKEIKVIDNLTNIINNFKAFIKAAHIKINSSLV
ncbi:hypothetical protein BU23DRAFT_462896, partial [Bimuria novae-zelandiae CBS 107.79]